MVLNFLHADLMATISACAVMSVYYHFAILYYTCSEWCLALFNALSGHGYGGFHEFLI
jgi:hypothetical protein